MRVSYTGLSSQHVKSGVFRVWDAQILPKLKTHCEAEDLLYVELAGSVITSKVEILDTLENLLHSPIPFNAHWDVFESEMKGPNWLPNVGAMIVYRDFQVFQKANHEEFSIFMAIVYALIHLKLYSTRNLETKRLYFVFYSEDKSELPPMELSVPNLIARRFE